MATLTGLGTFWGGSWVFNNVSTCSVRSMLAIEVVGSSLGTKLTQSLLQGLHVATLRAALPSLFVIGASMTETRTSTTTGSHTVTLELALPTYHAGQPLWLGYTGIVGDVLLRYGVVSIDVVATGTFMTASGRPGFW